MIDPPAAPRRAGRPDTPGCRTPPGPPGRMAGWISTCWPRCVPPRGRPRSPRRRGGRRRPARRGRRAALGRGAARAGRRRAHPGRAAPPRRAKFGPDAARMFLTRAGLEQATRRVVADRRAARLRAAGVRTLADLGCGLGADALAAARAGIRVYGVEADPLTAAMAAANAEARRAGRVVHRECGDATAFDVTGWTGSSATRPGAGPAPGGGSSTRTPTRHRGTSSPRSPSGCRTPWSSWPRGSTTR